MATLISMIVLGQLVACGGPTGSGQDLMTDAALVVDDLAVGDLESEYGDAGMLDQGGEDGVSSDGDGNAATGDSGSSEDSMPQCTSADYSAFAASLPTWFTAQYPHTVCIPPIGLAFCNACTQPCGTGLGCPVTIRHHDAHDDYQSDGAIGSFGSLVDVSVQVLVVCPGSPSATCDLAEIDASYQAQLELVDDASQVHAQVNGGSLSNANWGGCANLSTLAASFATAASQIVVLDAAQTLSADHAVCP